jgi:thiosulfate/3-mercaptopyruvate sulfurtransferase
MYTTLISAQDLHDHDRDPEWAIFDCRFELTAPEQGERAYIENHIPGAVYAHLDRDLAASPDGTNGRHPLPNVETMVRTLSSWGVDRKVQVVAYDDRGGGFAARLWWMLRYLGHEATAVLDGGFSAWKRAGYPLKSGMERRETRRFQASVQAEMVASLEEVRARSESQNARLIDARAPERYRGEQEPLDPVAGHIPGAINHFWQDNLDQQGQFRSADALRRTYRNLIGEEPPSAFIAYCGSGVTSCHNLLAMEHVGLEGARLYPGSWSEWCSDPERPVELGSED